MLWGVVLAKTLDRVTCPYRLRLCLLIVGIRADIHVDRCVK